MRAMVLQTPRQSLKYCDLPTPVPNSGELLLKISACGVCRTDLHIVDGELPNPKLPLVLGHEIIGQVVAVGPNTDKFVTGQRVGVPWLGWTCGLCTYCQNKQENLCDNAIFTGYQRDGGYAEYVVADARYCFALPDSYSDAEIAPLLCAGLIGWRALKLTGNCKRLGIYGFGAAAHIITQVALHQKRSVYAFTRTGDIDGQKFALALGATWVGDSNQTPTDVLDAAIIFAPIGALIPAALKAIGKGGKIVCGGIHMTDIPSFPYEILWGERSICSVANLTRQDAIEFLSIAKEVSIKTQVNKYPLALANEALDDLRSGKFNGAAVLTMNEPSQQKDL